MVCPFFPGSRRLPVHHDRLRACTCVLPCPTFCNPWTGACPAPLFMEFPSQAYWSGSALPTPGDLSDPGIEPASSALAGRFFPIVPPGKCKILHASARAQSCLFVAPWTVARQAPLSMEFARQEYWSGLPFPTPGDLSDPGIEPASLASLTLRGDFFTTGTTWELQ